MPFADAVENTTPKHTAYGCALTACAINLRSDLLLLCSTIL